MYSDFSSEKLAVAWMAWGHGGRVDVVRLVRQLTLCGGACGNGRS